MSQLINDRIHFEQDGPIARITLAHPSAGNALDLPMAQAFQAAADRIADNASTGGARVAVLAAQGRMFSVGGDLAAFAAASDPSALMPEITDAIHTGLDTLAACPIPVVTSVAGVAAGGGLGIALAGDIVLASDRAKFVAAYTAAGLSPDCGTSWYLSQAGSAVALDLLLTNRPLSPQEAERRGLISRVVDHDNLTAETEQVLTTLAAGSRTALAATKALLRDAATTLPGQLVAEAKSITALVDSSDAREGMAAFLDRRTPTFS